MKTTLIHKGLYLESLRRLRLATILLAAIPTAIMATMLFVDIFDAYSDLAQGFSVFKHDYASFIEVYWLLPALPFIVPVILSAVLFSQQNKRCDSDFYHSLPLTKRQLSASWFAAIVTSTAFVVLGSSLVIFTIDQINPGTQTPTWDAVVLPVFGACLAAIMVASVLFLSYNLSGNSVSALFTAAILLFAPHLITLAFSHSIAEDVSVVSVETLNTFQYFTLFWRYDYTLAWVLSLLAIAVCTLLGYSAAGCRKSEIAGQAAVSKVLQTILRLTAAFVVCLPAILIILGDWWMDDVVVWVFYVLAVVVYMLFELFTTKKAKNMLKSLPWLGVLAAMNVVAILGVNAATHSINAFCPTADEIDSVSVTKLITYDYSADLNSKSCIPATMYHVYAPLYNRSDCAKVELTDDLPKKVVAAALESTLGSRDGYTIEEYDSYYDAYGISPYGVTDYQIEVEIDTGLLTRKRIVWVNDTQLKALLGAIDEIEPLPVSDYYGGDFKPRV